jgi:hypothetical protein
MLALMNEGDRNKSRSLALLFLKCFSSYFFSSTFASRAEKCQTCVICGQSSGGHMLQRAAQISKPIFKRFRQLDTSLYEVSCVNNVVITS